MSIAIVLLVAVFVALLAIPITLNYRVSWRNELENDAEVIWAFGLVRARVPSKQPKLDSKNDDELSDAQESSGPSVFAMSKALSVFRHSAFRARLFNFLRDLLRAIDKRDIVLRVRVGLGDPADTGRLWAFVGPVSALLATSEKASVSVEPDFFDSTFELDSSGRVRIIPLRIFYLTAGLLVSPAFWSGVRRFGKAIKS